MNHLHRGFGIIFCSTEDRPGYEKEVDELYGLLQWLSFKTERYYDCTAAQLEDKLHQISQLDHTDKDCLFVAFFSHGIEGQFAVNGGMVHIAQQIDRFTGVNCPSLAGKPKIFYVMVSIKCATCSEQQDK